jgi:8-oxo-dGTP pyrophosphatase MutT (NUDIX family)
MLRTSCGVLVTDGVRLLLGHATRSPRWDIPKGVAEAGETHLAAALRELAEETGLAPRPEALLPLGVHSYMRQKALALFAWRPEPMPDPAALTCSAVIRLPGGAVIPEFDKFGLFAWPDALDRVGRNMTRVLGEVQPRLFDAISNVPFERSG